MVEHRENYSLSVDITKTGSSVLCIASWPSARSRCREEVACLLADFFDLDVKEAAVQR